MKRTVAAITTAVLAISLSAVGLSGGAYAAPAAGPTATPSASASPTPSGSASPTPSGSASASPSAAADCVSSPTYAYTFDRATFGGVITVSKDGVAAGTPLCKVLSVRSVSWTYDLPTYGQNPSYPQSFEAKQDVTVNAIGSFIYQAPDPTSGCRQHDIYASFKGFSDLAIPTSLTAAGKPFEPALLSTALGGRGPNPTYGHDLSAGCTIRLPIAIIAVSACLTDPENNTSTKVAELVYDNLLSNVPVTFSVAGTSTYTRTVAAKAILALPLPPIATTGASYTVVANGASLTLAITAFADCTGFVGGDSVVASTPAVAPQTCDPDVENAVLPGSITIVPTTGVKYTIHPESPTGPDIEVTGEVTEVAPGDYTVTATALSGTTLEGVTTWQRTVEDQSADCQLPTQAFLPASVTSANETCNNATPESGYIAIDPADGLTYFVGSTQLTSAKTSFAPGTYQVQAVAAPGDAIDGQSLFTVTVAAVSTACATTEVAVVGGPSAVGSGTDRANASGIGGLLAATGFNGGGLFLGLAGALILIGIGLITSAVISSGKQIKIRDKA